MTMRSSGQVVDDQEAVADGHGFEHLSRSYNYRTVPSRERLLTSFVVGELQRRGAPRTVLDVGCGGGMGSGRDAHNFVEQIRRHAEVFHGLEPDASVQIDHDCFDDVDRALLENTRFRPNTYDLLYCSLVLEHVVDPPRFFNAVERMLKPGGVFLGLTVNGNHHFTRLARLAHRLGVDELLLRMVRGSTLVDRYHYPVAYLCNSQQDLIRIAAQHGFEEPAFVMTERTEASHYFRGPLRPIHWAGAFRRTRFRNPAILLNLFVRLQKLPG